ncbi:Deoxyribodipyrimidine photo-lyase-related protein [Lacunisphaera limnophila]|uniref:Deoxyribodipyrimidine photo-lyase-related protein n=1 Tax=Lacunisphaera limnophila TaxID=1838286 RepID=A0A1D8AZ41_9BACT|nr:cryptochrome/photolyase family protein [Lacunisphaera limnophila]AOS46145.1 Deoxyribodipyrimidine photo-lyase-related protein [Lacunisphaera limnophila]
MPRPLRHLILVLGDQLDLAASAFDGFDCAQDAVWMAEVAEESTHVWSGRPRIALFLSAMRHHREALRAAGRTVHYRELEESGKGGGLAEELTRAIARLKPQRLILTEPGDWRVGEALVQAAKAAGCPLEVRDDRHFYATRADFATHARGRKQLRMEYFYREMRRKHGVLLDAAGEPEGGQWNFDPENRGSLLAGGPAGLKAPVKFEPDAITRGVIDLVNRVFADHPGKLDQFDWPVTTVEARVALQDFIAHRLEKFGQYQDAMWTEEAWLYHSRLAAAMNLKLLDPREVVGAAEQAWRKGRVPLAAAEGFIRQILGWREYVRGVYWRSMPGYVELNALEAHGALPQFYWTGDVPMVCLSQAIRQSLELGYAHHIQRLMVTGLYGLMLGVEPRKVHEWYLAVYVDAVEWVELPNTLGMSQYADGGIMASKPYVATGKYIQRMSNYCAGCRFDPAKATGPEACPFTTLYWDFLQRHEKRLAANPRMALQVKNLARLKPAELAAIRQQAGAIRANGGVPPVGPGEPGLLALT